MRPWILRSLIASVLAAGVGLYAYQAARQPGAVSTAPPTPESRFLPGTPAGHLESYLMGDFAGERLERANWSFKYKDMGLWDSEPAWDSAYVIRDFRIHTGQTTMRQAEAEVTFETLGILDLQAFTYTPSPTRQTVPYLLQAVDNRWKIAHPRLRPHVGLEAAKSYLQRMKVGYPQRAEAIDRSIRALEAETP
ncbi:MAG: hypothetical protein ACLGIN_05580 [Candidatus Sericytochromatia bacterium]